MGATPKPTPQNLISLNKGAARQEKASVAATTPDCRDFASLWLARPAVASTMPATSGLS